MAGACRGPLAVDTAPPATAPAPTTPPETAPAGMPPATAPAPTTPPETAPERLPPRRPRRERLPPRPPRAECSPRRRPPADDASRDRPGQRHPPRRPRWWNASRHYPVRERSRDGPRRPERLPPRPPPGDASGRDRSGPPPVLITSVEVAGAVKIVPRRHRGRGDQQGGGRLLEAQVAVDRQAVVDLGWFETVSVERESTEAGMRLVFRWWRTRSSPTSASTGSRRSAVGLLAVMKLKAGTVFNSR